MDLSAKVVVITGAAQGIGRKLAEKFAGAGAIVWALDLDEIGLKNLENEATKFKDELYTLKVDVTQKGAMIQARDLILSKHEQIHYWINNAGISGQGDFMEQTHEEFHQILKVNIEAVALGTRLALEHMESRGTGYIINMASVAGHIWAPFLTGYTASKHAVVGFTRALRSELKLKASSVKLILVSPGFVETQMIAKGSRLGFPEWLSWVLSTPEKVADEIFEGITRQREEIFPTLNGRVMLRLQRMFPNAMVASSRVLLARKFSDLIFNRPSA